MIPAQQSLDDLVGLDVDRTLPPLEQQRQQWALDRLIALRRRRLPQQVAGIGSGLAPFMHLPAPEARTLVRARLASTIASLVAANGNVTRDELLAAGFDEAELAEHFTQARRIARVERMVA